MAIYGCYTGKDMKSYFCDLTLADPKGGATLPTYRLSMGDPRQQTGTWQDNHVSTWWGSLTVILHGQIEFGVTGGARRSIIGKTGDIFVFVDTQGDGHSTHNPDFGDFQTANMRFQDSVDDLWGVFKKNFNGWPDNALTLSTYAPGGPPQGNHAGELDPKFDMKRFDRNI